MQFISLWVSDGNLNRSFNNTSHAIHLFWGVGWNSKTQFLVIALMQSSRLQLSGGTVEPQILIKSPMEFTSQRMSDGQCNANALSSATCAHKSKTHTLKVSCGASVRWSFWADGSKMPAHTPQNPCTFPLLGRSRPAPQLCACQGCPFHLQSLARRGAALEMLAKTKV